MQYSQLMLFYLYPYPLLFPLSTCHMERRIKLKDFQMFYPKSKQTHPRISTQHKFLHAFYNHKYYSFCI